MHNGNQQQIIKPADRDGTPLATRAGLAINFNVVTSEHPDRPFKPDPVLFPVGAVLRLVPFEFHQM